MLQRLKINLSERIDKQIERTYQRYKQSKLKKIEKDLAALVATERALLRKLQPIQQAIEAKKAEKKTLLDALRTV
jgi:predicted aminopeptidase